MNFKRYEEIYANFKRECPHVLQDVARWGPHGDWTIMLYLRNGDRAIYHDLFGSVMAIHKNMTEQEWRKYFSRSLEQMMRFKMITQKQLAEQSGLSQISITKYMNMRTTPSAYVIQRLADELQCSASDLVWFN